MEIKIAICDDSKIIVENMAILVQKYEWDNNTYLLYTYTSGKELLNSFTTEIVYNIVFLDINLKESSNGLEIGKAIKTKYPSSLLIYMSSFDSYYFDLVNAEPFKFLKKPFTTIELYKALNEAINRVLINNSGNFFLYKYGGDDHKLNLSDIMYMESVGRKTYLHLNSGTEIYFYNRTLDEIEETISNPYFLRPHQSFLVNFDYIDKKLPNHIVIEGKEIKITKKYKQAFNDNWDKLI